MTRRRVLHVIDSLAATGGAERRFVEEIVAMGDRFEQRVIRLFPRDDLQPVLEAAGIPVSTLGLSGRHSGRTWPLAVWRLRRTLRRWPPDVVHSSLAAANLAAQLAVRRAQVPVVSSFNRTGDVELQRRLQPGVASRRGRVMRRVTTWAARPSTVHFRAVSAYAGNTNGALYAVPPARVTVVPRGIDVADDGRDDRRRFGLTDGVSLFVNAARLVPEKRHDLLVEAFAVARAELPGAELAIAGAPGSHEPAVRAAIERHGLGDAVHLLGWRDDVHGLVAAADVFVFSSLSEGSPSAVVEAMALGTPVVAFAIAPVVEVTGGHARLVEPGSIAALAAAMVAAVRSDDRTGEIAAGRRWAAQFETATIAERLGDLLEARAGALR